MLKIFPRVLRGIFYIKHFLYAKKYDIMIGIERRDYMPKILLSVSLILFGLTPVLTQAAPVGRHFESNELDVTAVIPGTEGMSESWWCWCGWHRDCGIGPEQQDTR